MCNATEGSGVIMKKCGMSFWREKYNYRSNEKVYEEVQCLLLLMV